MFEDPLISIPLVLVPGLCLAATLLTAALGPRVLRQRSHVPVVVALGLAFLASVALLVQVHREADRAAEAGEPGGFERIVRLGTWAAVPEAYQQDWPSYARSQGRAIDHPPPAEVFGKGVLHNFRIEIALRADPLTAVMLVTVTLVSFLVAVYSIGYMHGDPGYWRFFTYISLFVFSMTMLVSVSNFVLLYAFWEAVGLCSYLLIGYWYQKPEAAAAGKKAFLVNRVGDFGFALGVFLLWVTYGTLDFHDTPGAGPFSSLGILGQARLLGSGAVVGGATGTAICLLLLIGACGKSAQAPLHVWLPDAMEGPTPVSALIHAATMVTAGVYLLARCAPLYAASPQALEVVAGIGGITALMAAIVAVTQTDLKRILAYSTISQLGYMFLAMGVGTLIGASAGMFHLVTHAFFKGLLFLGAGSVMHAMGNVIDIRRFGGLKDRLPVTHWTFLVGCLALAGFPFFSGFFSKDEILAAVHQRAMGGTAAGLYETLYLAALFTAFLTAFYTFRAYFVTFHGEERLPHEAGGHAHESPPVMTRPLVVLAVFSALIGVVLWLSDGLEAFLEHTPSLAYLAWQAEEPAPAAGHGSIAILSGVLAVAGIGLAWLLYLGAPQYLPRVTRAMRAVWAYQLSAGKFFFDQVYNLLVVWPMEGIARGSAWFDRTIIDGLVNAAGRLPVVAGAVFRTWQTGLVPFYALAMLLGLLVLLGSLLM